MKVKCNPEIFRIALGYLRIAELAEQQAIEIDSFYFAYKANLAFSIELFLKCIDAISTERLIFKVGDARITRLFAESNIHGHNLKKLFEKLEDSTKFRLLELFREHQYNISCRDLDCVLDEISDAFIKDRYAYENGGITQSDPNILLWTSRFFSQVLNQKGQ